MSDPEEQTIDVTQISPRLYANGFSLGTGNADLVTVLQLNGVPIAVLNMSYTLAKTLGESLLVAVKELEDKTGNEIMTTKFVDEKKKS